MARTLIVTPTYNERDNLAKFVGLVRAAFPPADVLIVDDASPDGTGALADELALADPQVRVLHRAGKLGLGTAYLDAFRLGLSEGYDRIFEMDADLSHDPKYLPAFVAELDRGADVVIGSRNIPGGGVPMSAGWFDVGAWGTTSEVMSKGAHGNTTHTDTILDGCEDSLLYGGKRLVAGFGLKDVIAVETLDAVLGADKSRTHVVKGIVTRIKAEASPTRTTRSTALDAGTTPSISVTASRPSAPRPIRTPSSTHRCTTNPPNTGSLSRARPKPPTVTE